MTQIAKPVTEELAQTDAAILGRTILGAAPYTDLLIPSDTVLAQKGRDYNVYREVLRDDQCKATFQQRRDAVIACNWDVEPGGKRAIDKAAAQFIKEQLEAIDFDRATNGMLHGVWYGHAVAECMWRTGGRYVELDRIIVRERHRFAYGVDGSLWLNRPTGYAQMPERKFWTLNTGADHDDEPYGLGLAHYCYWPVFFKRNDIKFWLVFLEKFASPTVKGAAPKAIIDDPVERNKVLAQLRSFAHDTAILVPEGVEVGLLEAARTGVSSYEGLCKAMDAAIAKIVLSQTMTTDNGSSRSQAEVHEGVRDIVVKSDADLLCGSLNQGPVKWLTEWNFPGAMPPRVWRNVEPPEDLNSRAERDAKIYALGYEPTEDYITETYGEGWQKKAVQQGVLPDQLGQIPSQLAAEFAELGAIAALRGSKRADQQQIADAARRFAARYEGVIGDRVSQILAFAEQSGDYVTARKHLAAMMAEAPPAQSVEAVADAGILSRLLGWFRGQR
jgi:phage gp29-like protein